MTANGFKKFLFWTYQPAPLTRKLPKILYSVQLYLVFPEPSTWKPHPGWIEKLKILHINISPWLYTLFKHTTQCYQRRA